MIISEQNYYALVLPLTFSKPKCTERETLKIKKKLPNNEI